jgi:monofunctional biosynthetic peptidoglycan transglycosylase
VAKNVFLWPARSWARKGLEVYFTALIETLWAKERILEVYLNVAEFGDGIYGAEAAARRCFGRSAKELTAEEAATLAAVLPNPRRYSAAQPSARVLRKRIWILQQMKNLGGHAYLQRLAAGPSVIRALADSPVS